MQSGGINITFPTVDWTTLIPEIVGLFFDAIGTFLDKLLHSTFDNVWGSGANVLGQTDLGMTWNFGPVHDQVMQAQRGASAVLLLALILLGIKSMLGGIVRAHHDVLSEIVNGVLMAVIMTSAFPVVIPALIEFTNQVATAMGTVDLSRYMASGSGLPPIISVVLFVILLFFGFRLLMRGAWRILVLAVLLPVGMVACAVYAIPALRWVFSWWAKLWGGLLLAQIPSVFALSIGLQLFAHGSGIMAFIFSIAAMQVATDVYQLIPLGALGGGRPPWSGLPIAPLAMRAATPQAAVGVAAVGATTMMTDRQIASHYGYK